MILQAPTCSLEEWALGDWHNCVFDPVPALIGEPLFGLLVGSGLWLSMYFAAGGKTSTPTAVILLVSTLVFPILPGGMVGIAKGILIIGVAAAIMQVLQKYVLNPATT